MLAGSMERSYRRYNISNIGTGSFLFYFCFSNRVALNRSNTVYLTLPNLWLSEVLFTTALLYRAGHGKR